MKLKNWVRVTGDSVLWGLTSAEQQEACCLSRAMMRDIVKRLIRLVSPSDYYYLLLFPVGVRVRIRGDLDKVWPWE